MGLCALVAGILLGGTLSCTAPNPEFDSPCAAGARICVESPLRAPYPVVCGESGSGTLTLQDERCPGGQCQSGLCLAPAGARPCARQGDCRGNEVCVPLLSAIDDRVLSSRCVPAAAAPVPPGGRCDKDGDCQSYLCLPYRSGNYCLRSCQSATDCIVPDDCRTLNVTITGVAGTLQSCSPAPK